MEIKEIVSYYLNGETDILEVAFRTIDDDDEILRSDNIDYSVAIDYGFDLITESLNFFDDEFEDDSVDENEEIELDEEELLNFLNEYYTIYPEKLPKGEMY